MFSSLFCSPCSCCEPLVQGVCVTASLENTASVSPRFRPRKQHPPPLRPAFALLASLSRARSSYRLYLVVHEVHGFVFCRLFDEWRSCRTCGTRNTQARVVWKFVFMGLIARSDRGLAIDHSPLATDDGTVLGVSIGSVSYGHNNAHSVSVQGGI